MTRFRLNTKIKDGVGFQVTLVSLLTGSFHIYIQLEGRIGEVRRVNKRLELRVHLLFFFSGGFTYVYLYLSLYILRFSLPVYPFLCPFIYISTLFNR